MRKMILWLALSSVLTLGKADVGDLLITEISVVPFGAEFIEIHNKGTTTVDLSNVYLTDATFANGAAFYYKIVTGNGGGGGYYDFNARFPDGATIEAGGYQTISVNGSAEFFSALGVNPTYELYEDGATADSIPDMRPATPNSIATPTSTSSAVCPGSQTSCPSGLTDSGEIVILYTWDGVSDLVQDLDYVVWGDKAEAVDKTGVSIDGPDADSTSSTYLADTAIASQIAIAGGAHAAGMTWQRNDLNEGAEVKTGGNGYVSTSSTNADTIFSNGFEAPNSNQSGHNETSENTNVTFTEAAPTPNAETGGMPPANAPNILINEVDAVGSVEFVEIYGDANASLNNVKVVFYDGNTNQVYNVLGLSGLSTNSSGYLLIGDASLNPDVTLPANSIQDGADAVAIYFTTDAVNIGDNLTATGIVDAFVYDSGQADDADLLALLNASQPQIDENGNGNAATESNARCPNGAGGVLNTATYQQVSPTPGIVNNSCSSNYYAAVTPAVEANPALLRSTLHDIIDNHNAGSYSQAWTILSFADEDPTDSSKVRMVYSNESLTWQGGGQQAYNREHTWPKSYGFSSSGLTPHNDTHHLMLSNKDYNSRRGNLYFDDCTSQFCSNSGLTTVLNHGVGGPGEDNVRDGNVFQVWNFRKGDIARAMFYMDVRYSGDIGGEPDLILTDNTSLIDGGSTYMGKLTTLCEWHYADPVDTIEQQRNEVIFSYQENRNPFIDHPEWAAKVFAECAAVAP